MAVVCVPLLVSAAKFHCHHNLQHILKNLQAEKAADIIPRMQRIGYHMINCTKEVAGFIPLTDFQICRITTGNFAFYRFFT